MDEWTIPVTAERKTVACPDCYQKHGQITPLWFGFKPDPDAAYYLPDGERIGWADGGERLYCMRCWWSCLRSAISPELLEGWTE